MTTSSLGSRQQHGVDRSENVNGSEVKGTVMVLKRTQPQSLAFETGLSAVEVTSMDTPATSNIPIPTLAGVVVCDSFPTGDDMADRTRPTAGSARWPFEPDSPAHGQIALVLRAARELGYAVPDGLLFRAGQVFYHNGRVIEVRLTGLLPTTPDATGQP